MKEGRLKEALAEYNEALKLEPHYSQVHQQIGELHLALGNIAAAQRSFSLAAVTFGRLRSLLKIYGREMVDLNAEDTEFLLFSAKEQEERGRQIWVEPYRRLSFVLTRYDGRGRRIPEQTRTLLLMAHEDRKGIIPPAVLKDAGITDVMKEHFDQGMDFAAIVEIHERLSSTVGTYRPYVDATLALEDEQWDTAIQGIEQLVELNRARSVQRQELMWLLANLQLKKADAAGAMVTLKALVEEFPDYQDAKKLLDGSLASSPSRQAPGRREDTGPLEIVGTDGDIRIALVAPRGWRRAASRLPEADNSDLTLASADASAWVAFSVSTLADPGETASPGLLAAFGNERVHPFMDRYLGIPSNWRDGQRDYFQIGWIPKRKSNANRLLAQTSVMWDSTRGLRFEILQVLVDDGTLFAFRDKVGFAFECQISQAGQPIFPR